MPGDVAGGQRHPPAGWQRRVPLACTYRRPRRERSSWSHERCSMRRPTRAAPQGTQLERRWRRRIAAAAAGDAAGDRGAQRTGGRYADDGDDEYGGGAVSSTVPSAGGAHVGTFTFEHELCEGLTTLITFSGIVDDGLFGQGHLYGGAARNCSWLRSQRRVWTTAGSPSIPLPRLLPRCRALPYSQPSPLDLRDGLDELAIYNGAAIDESAPSPLSRRRGRLWNATGACTQLVRARSGSALVRLLSSPRDDGTSSRLSMLYFTIDAADDGFFYSLWERTRPARC